MKLIMLTLHLGPVSELQDFFKADVALGSLCLVPSSSLEIVDLVLTLLQLHSLILEKLHLSFLVVNLNSERIILFCQLLDLDLGMLQLE